MKKKIAWGIILVLLLAAGLAIASGFTFTISRSVNIDASLDIVAPQVSQLRNWKNWYGRGADRLSPISVGPVSIVVRDTARPFEEAVAVVPAMDGRSTRAVWSRPVTVRQWLLGSAVAEMVGDLAALKQYIEDPRSYYGFDIHIRPVTDTLFVTKEARIGEAAVATMRPVLLRALRAYLAAHPGMGNKDSVITGYEPLAGGLVHLVVGVPLYRRGPVVDSVRFLELPRGGRLLSGLCEDSGQLGVLRRAMDRYMADKRLQMVAIPFTAQGSGSGLALNYPIW